MGLLLQAPRRQARRVDITKPPSEYSDKHIAATKRDELVIWCVTASGSSPRCFSDMEDGTVFVDFIFGLSIDLKLKRKPLIAAIKNA